MKDKNDTSVGQQLRGAPLPEPVGGHEAARERLMGRVRHTFPIESVPPRRTPRLFRSLAASLAIGGLATVVFLAWPQQKAEADPLPTEVQMQQFYDQHETHHVAHFEAQGALQ